LSLLGLYYDDIEMLHSSGGKRQCPSIFPAECVPAKVSSIQVDLLVNLA